MRATSIPTRWIGVMLATGLPIVMACASAAAAPHPEPVLPVVQVDSRPNLVVLLVVDQLRGDLLGRYSSAFTGGFKRLLDEGLKFSRATHDHAQTETSPGHATISTGVFPSRSGIPSNAWREGEGRDLHTVYNVVDPSKGLAGVPDLPGSSPDVLRRTGLADWILQGQVGAKVVSVSAKDRAAILLAGKAKGEVYWFDSRVGRFVTSTYYRNREPAWLRSFNLGGMAKYRLDSTWVSTVPPELARMSAPDTADFEGDGIHSFFPHVFSQEVVDPRPEDFNFWFENTPMLDKATLEVALLAMEEEELGKQEGRTDFLAISFSQTDRVGHKYGPLSREQMDNLLRLDGLLKDLFTVLDFQIGRENYVVALTSDHGVMNNPERLEPEGQRLTEVERSKLETALSAAARQAGMRRDISTSQVMMEAMDALPFVGPKYTHEQLQGRVSGDSIAVLFQHSYTSGRAGGLLSTYGIEMWWAEYVLSWSVPLGTTHGSPFYYDRWVPLIFMGPGIEAGVVDEPVHSVDVAPTLAVLAGILYPDDLDGKPLLPKRN